MSQIGPLRQRQPPVLIAIPAKDEADRIAGCLNALHRQTVRPDQVLLLLNNCSDNSEAVAQRLRRVLGFDLRIVVRKLPPHQANAGHARRLAMALAAGKAAGHAVLLTTDADAVPPPDWIARNLAAIDRGADVVCGRAVIGAWDARLIPEHLRLDDALEREFIGLLDNMAGILDPEPADPLPRHTEASGASLALKVAAFRGAGGVPAVSCAEDRALVRALWERDARVRHDPQIEVTVSGRTDGRAVGGMAETLRRRFIRQDEFTDVLAEPAYLAWRRYALRSRVRRVWHGQTDAGLARDLAVPAGVLDSLPGQAHFGAAWAVIERASPRLVRQRVRFADLPNEISVAQCLLPFDAMAAD